jgi:hypothetical protein
MMNDLEMRVRCLEMAERVMMRCHINNADDILVLFEKLYYHVNTRLSPACPEAPEEDQKELSYAAPFQPSSDLKSDRVEKSSSVLKGKPGKTILD